MQSFRTNIILIIIAFAFSVQSCNLINPEEPQPAYLEVNHVTVSSNYPSQGTNASKVKDVWVYVDGQYLGTFELPAKIPVLAEGSKQVILLPGIYENGIAATRSAYPLYKGYTATLNFTPGQTTLVDTFPVSYFPALSYTWYEDFEKDTSGGGISMETTTNSLAGLAIDSTIVYEGKRSLKLEATSSNYIIEATSVNDGYYLARGKDIYLEINYKSTHAFTVGLKGILSNDTRNIPVILFNPSTDWNKTYINLSKFVNANYDVSKFKVYFYMQLESGESTGTLYIDNVKLISN